MPKPYKRQRSNTSDSPESLQLVPSKPRTRVQRLRLSPPPDLFERDFGNDAIHLQFYRSLWGTPTAGLRHFPRADGSGVNIQILNVEYFLRPTIPYIRAILVLTSMMPADQIRAFLRRPTQEYIEEFRRSVETARTEGEDVNSISGFYLMTQISLIYEQCITQSLSHYGNFCQRFKALKESEEEDDDRIATVELLWQQQLKGGLLRVLRQRIVDSLTTRPWGQPVLDPDIYNNVAVRIGDMLDKWSCLLLSDQELDDYGLEMDTVSLCHRIKSLAINLQIILDIYLYRVSTSGRTEEQSERTKRLRDKLLTISATLFRAIKHLPVADYIRNVSKLTVRMETQSDITHPFDVPQVKLHGLLSTPTLRDTALVQTYFFARLLNTVLENNEVQDETATRKMIQYARAMGILCACLPSEELYAPSVTLLKARYLFYAGSILTQSVDSDGTLLLSFKANSSEFKDPCKIERLRSFAPQMVSV